MKHLALLALVTASLVSQASAQAPQIKVDIKELKLEQQLTPMFQAAGVVEKRWKPKTWIELDMGIKIKLPRAEGGDDASAGSLEVRYFVATSAKDKEGKIIVISGNITYENIPADDEAHALAYISPSTLKRVLMKDNGNKADVSAFGVDIYYNGQPTATQSSAGQRWWANGTEPNSDKFTFQEGILPKAKTPFAIMFGDYDLQVSQK